MSVDPTSLFIGAIVGFVIAGLVMVLVMAPKHWDWFEQNKMLKATLIEKDQEIAHWRSLAPAVYRQREWEDVRIITHGNQ